MKDRFDVIIVGARCAGSPLAILLARAGLNVCLVDRSKFPSEVLSTHGIQPSGVKILDRLGVRDAVQRVAGVVEHGTLAFDDARIELSSVTELAGAPMLNVRRIALDAILLDAAAAAGAEIRTETAVTGLLEEGGRVAGVKTGAGDLRAPLVVGADGVRSTVAELAGAQEYHQTPAGRLFIWGYFEGAQADRDRVWIGKIGDHAFLASATDADMFMAAVAPSMDRRAEVLGDRKAAYLGGLASWPELEDAVAGARQVGPLRLMARWHGYFRESAGPGWALVGDAGHFKDPTPGQGIADAFRQVAELAPAIEKALGGGSQDTVLRDWWHWRDKDAWEMYWLAVDMGAAGEAPLIVQAVQQRMADDPALADRLLKVLNHDLAPSKLVTPAFGLRVASRELVHRRGRRREVLREIRGLIADELRNRRGPARGRPS